MPPLDLGPFLHNNLCRILTAVPDAKLEVIEDL